MIACAASTAAMSSASSTSAEETQWVEYAEEANGDLYFYDISRIEKTGSVRRVWSGIRYKTPRMSAFSFMSLLEIDCSNRTEKTLQSTFFTDKNWERAAMKTDTTETENRQIETESAIERLANIVCDM
ncbi:MAG: surface-adhesin E family protein [Pseudomonadota bacterium]